MIYNATKLDAELKAAGLKIAGCSSNGRVDFIDPPTQQEIAIAEAVKAAHDPLAMTGSELRLDALRAKIRNRTQTVNDIAEYIELRGL